MAVLILGGTSEARSVAAGLDECGVSIVSSLAGRVQRPRLPVGAVRIGGFGGIAKMADYLHDEQIDAVIDATHPFAATISDNAVAACAHAGVKLLRLQRPSWASHPDASRWHWVERHEDAATTAAARGTRILLTTGRQPLPAFVESLRDAHVLARMVDPPQIAIPKRWIVLLDRGPYTYGGEQQLMREHRCEVLVTKDSGGSHTQAKLDAARDLHVEVVIVRRPAWDGADRFTLTESVDAAVSWIVAAI